MTKADIIKINEFISEVTKITDELVTYEEQKILLASEITEDEKKIIHEIIKSRIHLIEDVKIRIEGFIRAVLSETSTYINEINKLIFYVKETTLTTQISNDIWKENKNKLLNLLFKAKIEFEEKLRIGKQQNSIRSFFQTNQAKGIILTSFLGLIVGITSKDLIFDKISWRELGSAFPNFEVVEFKRIVDLSQWTPTKTDNLDDLSGKAIFDDHILVRKIRDEGEDFCLTSGSSGSNPEFTSQTHKIKQTSIEMKLEGWPNLKNQALAILDVSKEKSNTIFPVNIRSVRYRGFKDERANWCSVGVWHMTKELIFQVKFPKGKMGSSFSYSTSFFYDRNNFEKLHPSNTHLIIDSTSLTWRVDYPIIGNAYRLDWNW